VSIGNGIYKSTDGGDSWTNMGLANSERIAKIMIDPKNSNTVYVCVPGKLWSDSEDRGVYKTTDGGKSWNKILKGANLSTGCSMISMSSQDPKVLFAGMWTSGERAGLSVRVARMPPRRAAAVFPDRGWRSHLERIG